VIRRRLSSCSRSAADGSGGVADDEDVELGTGALRRSPRAAHDAQGARRELCEREQALRDRVGGRAAEQALLARVEVVADQELGLDLLGDLAG
jgi:hypothetical protein